MTRGILTYVLPLDFRFGVAGGAGGVAGGAAAAVRRRGKSSSRRSNRSAISAIGSST